MRWPRIGRPLIALSRAEARRITSHPAVLASLVLVVGPWAYRIVRTPNHTWFADLTAESWGVQIPMLLVAASVLLASCLSAVRSSRFQTLEWERGQALRFPHQIAAQLLAVLPATILTAVFATLWLLYLGSRPGASGRILWWEVLTVPAMVLLAGVLGVSLGRLTGSLPGSLLVVAVLAVISLIGLITNDSLRWLGLAAAENSFVIPPAPASLVSRPAAAHVAWLVALAGLLAVAALMRFGLRGRLGYPLVAALLAIGVIANAVQLDAPPAQRTSAWRTAVANPTSAQECTTSGKVTFCYFPDFKEQVPAWAAITSSQLSVVPKATAEQSFYVRQRLAPAGEAGKMPTLPLKDWERADARADTPNSVPVSTRWAPAGVDTFSQTQVLAFSVSFAMRAVLGRSPTEVSTGSQTSALCGGPGALVYWLGTATSDASTSALEVIRRHTAGGAGLAVDILGSDESLIIGQRESELGDRLARLPLAQAASVVESQWSGLSSPATSVEEAAAMVGLEAPDRVPEPDQGLCP